MEKGAGGQDSRFVLVGSRGATRCSVLTLNRAGEDGAAFDLTDKALAAIAGADSRLQEAITTGEVVQAFDGERPGLCDVLGEQSHGHAGEYAVKITVDNTGRLFAYVLTAPERTFEQERENLREDVGQLRDLRLPSRSSCENPSRRGTLGSSSHPRRLPNPRGRKTRRGARAMWCYA